MLLHSLLVVRLELTAVSPASALLLELLSTFFSWACSFSTFFSTSKCKVRIGELGRNNSFLGPIRGAPPGWPH